MLIVFELHAFYQSIFSFAIWKLDYFLLFHFTKIIFISSRKMKKKILLPSFRECTALYSLLRITKEFIFIVLMPGEWRNCLQTRGSGGEVLRHHLQHPRGTGRTWWPTCGSEEDLPSGQCQ